MNSVNNPNKMSLYDSYRYMGRDLKMYWEKNGGKICTIAGTTGLILSGIHSCRKTYRIHDDLVKNGRKIREAREAKIDGEGKIKRFGRISKAVLKSSLMTAKHYIPDIVAGGLSAYATRKGWSYEHGHYQKAAAMVGVLAADFMNYRMNVISDLGKEADQRYLNQKHTEKDDIKLLGKGDSEQKENKNTSENSDGVVIQIDPRHLRILYSRATTRGVWSHSHVLRINQLEGIENDLNHDLIYGGFYTVNDFRRHFYGKKGDVPEGGIYGRCWDPGNPLHPERGRMVRLSYHDDQDFMDGIKDWCWIEIEIDDEPLIETVMAKNVDAESIPPVEDYDTSGIY